MADASLLVIGAGPYGLAVAARALEHGIDTVVVGKAMGFWTENMPAGMFLRSGPDWHLDASGVHTFEAFLEEQSIPAAEVDPVPIDVFLRYCHWFQTHKGITVQDRLVTSLEVRDGRFVAAFVDGGEMTADRVVAAVGNRYFRRLPHWAADLPTGIGEHTCDFVRFDEMTGARVLIVGGRQSAYEWAALLAEHGAERVDIVHRHNMPRFDRVSWAFADKHTDATLNDPGWWRSLSAAEQRDLTYRFWEVGRLTLEWWLVPRLAGDWLHRWPRTHVVNATGRPDGMCRATLSNGERLLVDKVVFATGYASDLSDVPYLAPMVATVETAQGFPVLDEAFQSSVPGLYFPGFAATRDFGPVFGFTKACLVAATLIVNDLDRNKSIRPRLYESA